MSMYAIAFDLDIEALNESYHNGSANNAYGDIKKFLIQKGFKSQQESVYFGNKDTVNAVTCIMAVQELARKYSWFSSSVRDIQMLRIEENSDLAPAIASVCKSE